MKTYFLIPAVLLFLLTQNSFSQTKYSFDKAKSEIVWIGKKISGQHKGNISVASGEFSIDKDNNLTAAVIEIDMNSMTCTDLEDKEYNGKLLGHLKSPDFFDTQKYPKAVFKIKKPVKIDKGNAIVKGELTIKDVTLPHEFKAVFVKSESGFKVFANFSIDRSKFNVKYGSGSFFGDLGDKTIYDDFDLFLNLSSNTVK